MKFTVGRFSYSVVTVIVMVVVIIIIIIITFTWSGRNRVQITCNTSSAYHVQHVVLRATWYEGTAQLLSLTEFKLHLFDLYFFS